MSLSVIIQLTVANMKALGYREADNRRPIEAQSEMAAHRMFQVEARPVDPILAQHAISNDVRRAIVTVRIAYFVGGGDTGRGDRFSINAQAGNDILKIVAPYLQNPTHYDAQNTGLQRMHDFELFQSVDNDRAQVWDLMLRAQWEQPEDTRAVAA